MQTDDHHDATESGTTFEEWLEVTAESKRIDRAELLDQLVSSYWTLTEIVGLVGSTSGHVDADANRATETDAGSAFDIPLGGPQSDELASIRGTVQVIDDRLASLERSVRNNSATVSPDSFRELAEETSTATERTAARHDTLAHFVSEEFDNLRSILEHLIAITDDLDERANRAETTLADLFGHVSNDESLARLKQQANRMGAERADCAHCGATLRLSLLVGPVCPQCACEFDGLERRGGGLLSSESTVLRTVTESDDATGRRLTWDEPTGVEKRDPAAVHGQANERRRPRSPFVWLSDDQLDEPGN